MHVPCAPPPGSGNTPRRPSPYYSPITQPKIRYTPSPQDPRHVHHALLPVFFKPFKYHRRPRVRAPGVQAGPGKLQWEIGWTRYLSWAVGRLVERHRFICGEHGGDAREYDRRRGQSGRGCRRIGHGGRWYQHGAAEGAGSGGGCWCQA
ncbi:hypothetical protein D9619_011025 [Psilocybe cf. subviscida]|uniref:Uncharacterized protein n=1 Tax=Psilocybe cf. subviscida TaxID=2480587 RepID=A0A8H5BAP4_9AGAR|nr:hypothetical protein D9619_011025 [Psilocybe cf. subviscida]